MADNPFLDRIASSWEEEGLFARDLQGQLIRVEAATQRDYSTLIEMEIDGQTISVPKAVPQTDSQGNLILDEVGRTSPRRTTIYDAAYRLFGEDLRGKHIIPTLCHLDHLHPVGVCRVCSVVVAKREKDRKDPTKTREVTGEKLLPACVQPVEPGMIVHTRLSAANKKAGERVTTSVRVLLELLGADHLQQAHPSLQRTPSDLEKLISAFASGDVTSHAPQPARFRTGSSPPRRKDDSSHFIAVDHGACILCDRCSRACSDIKHNYVIGRTGKGYSARIGFDLNDPMGTSSCVECGECMLSCPTQALTFRNPIESKWHAQEVTLPGRLAVQLEELARDRLLGTLPQRWLEWNATSIVRWEVQAGDTICELGQYGATAFVIQSGRYEVLAPQRRISTSAGPPPRRGWLSSLFDKNGSAEASPGKLHKVDEMTADDFIFGEMSCLSSYPRNATIRAIEPGVIYIIRRNVLHALQRNPRSREVLDACYLTRAIFDHVRKIDFFEELTPEERERCETILRNEATLLTLDPGQPIFRQGERPDAFYMVRIGHVKLTETYAGSERILTYLGPNKLLGDVALVLKLGIRGLLDPESARLLAAVVDESASEPLDARRTASAIALDDVELVRVSPETFRRLLSEFPPLRNRFVENAVQVVQRRQQRQGQNPAHNQTHAFVEQGLYNAKALLVIDLESCTRCDECTRACSDTHEGITRLIRDGMRFDKFLVASSCRSCTDPYCLVGCPVDSIHRVGERLEVRIEDHCIGCGLCANNCPYGNINMVGSVEKPPSMLQAMTGAKAVVRHRATTCDLCTNVVGPQETVSCVYACPHHAAFRMEGADLLQIVKQGTSGNT
jgi:Fe-S-cluster-containing hydrogenase component 2/CRP-like cAMP-binding protein